MEIATKKFARFLLVMGLIAFLSVAFFGASQSMGMEMRDDGTMGGCLFIGVEEICKMSLIEHLSQWQSIFATIAPQQAITFALLLLLAVVFVIVATIKHNLLLPFNHYTTRWRLYIRQNPHLNLFNHLRAAFTRGILNPKIY